MFISDFYYLIPNKLRDYVKEVKNKKVPFEKPRRMQNIFKSKQEISLNLAQDLDSVHFRVFCISIPCFISWHAMLFLFYPQKDIFNSTMYAAAMLKYAVFFTYCLAKPFIKYQLSFHQLLTWANLVIGMHFIVNCYNVVFNLRVNPVYANQNSAAPSLYFLWIVSMAENFQDNSYWRKSWNFWNFAPIPCLVLASLARVLVGTVPSFEFYEVLSRVYSVATVLFIMQSTRNDTLLNWQHKTALTKAAADLHSRFYAMMSHVCYLNKFCFVLYLQYILFMLAS